MITNCFLASRSRARIIQCTTAVSAALLFLSPTWRLCAQAPPRITKTSRSAHSLHLGWAGATGTYEVQASPTLTDPKWRPIYITERMKAEIGAEGQTQFYRLVTPPTVTPDAAVDEARRLDLLTGMNQRIATLPGEDDAADARALLSFLAGLSEFNDFGLTADSSVWARFRDGRLLIVLNNRLSGEIPAPAGLAASAPTLDHVRPVPSSPLPSGGKHPGTTEETRPELMDVQSVRPTSLPESRNALLFKATLPSIDAPILNQLVPAFGNHQYDVMGGEATLPQLKNVRNVGADVGVLYIDSHGGLAVSRSITTNATTGDRIILDDTLFAVATSTTVTPANERLYEADFLNGEVCYAVLGPKTLKGLRRTSGPSATFAPFYCILPGFVRRHWTFGRNSLVYIDTCHGGSQGATSFIEACITKGASSYAGWSKEVDDSGAQQTTQVLFDTLLGAGQILNLTPSQRAFDRMAVVTYLERTRFDTDPKNGAKLTFFEPSDRGSDFGVLAPSIYSMSVDESKEELRIVGLFDTEAPTKVRVKGGGGSQEIEATARRIESGGMALNPTEVICRLPARQQPSAGDVTVIQRGRESNAVPLTEWWVKATGEKYFAVGQPQPSARMTFQLHFRADVHHSRSQPYEAPIFRGASASAASDSTSRVISASGVYPYPDGNGNVTWSLPQPVDLNITYVGFNTVDSAFFGSLVLAGSGSGTLTMIAKAKNAMTVTQTLNNVQNSYQTDPGTRTFPPGQFRFDQTTFNIQSGSGPAASDSGVFQWETSAAAFAPDRSAPGYAE